MACALRYLYDNTNYLKYMIICCRILKVMPSPPFKLAALWKQCQFLTFLVNKVMPQLKEQPFEEVIKRESLCSLKCNAGWTAWLHALLNNLRSYLWFYLNLTDISWNYGLYLPGSSVKWKSVISCSTIQYNQLEAVWPSGLGCWHCNLEVLGSRPPPCH